MALLVVQAILTLPALASDPLWVDEAYSALLASESFPRIIERLQTDAGPPLYYFGLHGWQFIFGTAEWSLRLPSALFALLTTCTLYGIAAREGSRWFALISAALWGLNPLVWHYAHEARNYTLLAWLTLVFLYGIYGFRQQPGIRTLWWVAVGVALLYTHNLGLFVVATGIIFLPWFPPQKKTLVLCSTAIATLGIAYLPWVPTLLSQMSHTEQSIGWVHAFWTPWAPLLSLNAFLPGGWTPLYMDRPFLPFVFQGVLVLATLALAGYAIHRKGSVPRMAIGAGMAVLLLLAMPYVVSLLGEPVYLVARTDFAALPLFCLLIASLLTSIPRIPFPVIVLVVYAGTSLAVIGMEATRTAPVNQRVVMQFLHRSVQPGDAVVCTGLTRPVVAYALRDRAVHLISYPASMEQHLAHMNEAALVKTLDLPHEAQRTINRLQNLAESRTIWIISSPRRINQPLMDALGDRIDRIPLPDAGLRKLNEPLGVYRYVPSF